jgi:REP element-mobilizing transposase RayT
MPHFDSQSLVQHVTYHLADSLPCDILARLKEQLRCVPASRYGAERRKRIEAWLDAGHGCCLLRHAAAARVVQDSFLHFDGERYRLLAWVVMPNHVHVLFQAMEGWTLAQIVAAWKSFTGRRLAPLMLASVQARRVWRREYWDRFIRD